MQEVSHYRLKHRRHEKCSHNATAWAQSSKQDMIAHSISSTHIMTRPLHEPYLHSKITQFHVSKFGYTGRSCLSNMTLGHAQGYTRHSRRTGAESRGGSSVVEISGGTGGSGSSSTLTSYSRCLDSSLIRYHQHNLSLSTCPTAIGISYQRRRHCNMRPSIFIGSR